MIESVSLHYHFFIQTRITTTSQETKTKRITLVQPNLPFHFPVPTPLLPSQSIHTITLSLKYSSIPSFTSSNTHFFLSLSLSLSALPHPSRFSPLAHFPPRTCCMHTTTPAPRNTLPHGKALLRVLHCYGGIPVPLYAYVYVYVLYV